MANGIDVVFDRVNETALQAREVSVLDPKHAPLIARLNVYRAFEPIEPTRSVFLFLSLSFLLDRSF